MTKERWADSVILNYIEQGFLFSFKCHAQRKKIEILREKKFVHSDWMRKIPSLYLAFIFIWWRYIGEYNYSANINIKTINLVLYTIGLSFTIKAFLNISFANNIIKFLREKKEKMLLHFESILRIEMIDVLHWAVGFLCLPTVWCNQIGTVFR